ncbi:MAG TPA: histidine kinase, partial [Actinomycetota bacterium]|nr:histidine kinase [Actinomycetota bacterium]
VMMPPSEPLDPNRMKLLGDVATHAGLVLRNVTLLEDLRASRTRIVTAQDERARRLERNIHDGAQQQLVGLTVKLRLAQALVTADPARAEAMLGELQTEAKAALEDLRDLARGIYPPLLADNGLRDAVAAQARKATLPVRVEADGIGRYAQDVEAAVYFCTLEALTNTTKYAGASSATVRLWHEGGTLGFSVSDDGRGFDPGSASGGTGLVGMADRLAAVGGAIEIISRVGEGTTIVGRVPVQGSER